MVWCLGLRRNLKEHEETQFISLLNFLYGVYIQDRREDERVWNATKKWLFFFWSLISSWSFLERTRGRTSVTSIWKYKAPPRVVIFGWLVFQKGILTMDNLRRRGKLVVNDCPMCLRDEEMVNHLLLNFKFAQMV